MVELAPDQLSRRSRVAGYDFARAVAWRDHHAHKEAHYTRQAHDGQRNSTKRERLKNRNATFFAKRTSTGRFKEMDEAGRSLKTDRRTKAKRSVKAGYGDKGDRRRAA